MFGNFFNFQSKNKDGKAGKDESSKKSKNKKGKDNKKESAVEDNDAKLTLDVIKIDDDEQVAILLKLFSFVINAPPK